MYNLRVCLSSTFGSGSMQNEIPDIGERQNINEP